MSRNLEFEALPDFFAEATLEEKYYFLDSSLDSILMADLLVARGEWVQTFLADRKTKGEYARTFSDLLQDDTSITRQKLPLKFEISWCTTSIAQRVG